MMWNMEGEMLFIRELLMSREGCLGLRWSSVHGQWCSALEVLPVRLAGEVVYEGKTT